MTYTHWKKEKDALGHFKAKPPAWMVIGASWRVNQLWRLQFEEADKLAQRGKGWDR